MLLKIVKIKLKIFTRNFFHLFRKENLIRSIINLIVVIFFGNFLTNTYYINKLLLANSNLEKISTAFKNQLIIFLLFFTIMIIYKIYKIYSKEDKDLNILPISDKVVLYYYFLKISSIIFIFDLFFIIFYRGFLFTLSQDPFFSIILLVLFQIVIVFFSFYFIYKILLHKGKLFILLISFFTIILLGILIKSNYTFYFLSLFKRYLFTIPFNYFINLLTLEQSQNIYLIFCLLSFAILCFFYQVFKHNFNPLLLSSIRKNLYKELIQKEKVKSEKKELFNKHLLLSQSLNKYFIVKDIRILLREVGFRIIIISILFLFFTLFALDHLKEGKIILGKLILMGFFGYFALLYSWLVALPSVGSEGLFLGFLRNSISLKKVLKSKVIFSFMVNFFLGLIISIIPMIILFKNGFLDFYFLALILFTIVEFAFVLSFSGVIIGSFFPNFRDKSRERLKKVSLTGQIVYFISAPFLILLVVIMDLLFFYHLILFLLGVIIFNTTVFFTSSLLLKGAKVHLNKIEL